MRTEVRSIFPSASQGSVLVRLLQDRVYYLALFAGLVVWLFLYFNPALLEGVDFRVDSFWRVFAFCLLYPVVEELVFRGALQGWLISTRLGGVSLAGLSYANLLTTVAFVAVHFIHQPIVWALAVIVPSLLFGFFRDKYSSVLPAVILHCFYNTGFYLTLQLVLGVNTL